MDGVAATEAGMVRLEADLEAGENRLVLRAQAGDRTAFGDLYAAHVRAVYGVCLRMLHDPEDAADVASEAFVSAMEHLGSLREPSAFPGWVRAIARNAALRRLAQGRRTCELPEGLEARLPDRGSGSDPAAAAEQREISDLVAEAAATLSPRYALIFDLHVRRGWDATRVARALDVNTAHAYVLVSRVREALREGLCAVVMARGTGGGCAAGHAICREFGKERSPRMRQAILRHVRACEVCRARIHPSLTPAR